MGRGTEKGPPIKVSCEIGSGNRQPRTSIRIVPDILPGSRKHTPEVEISTGIRIDQGIIKHIGIAVVALEVIRILHIGIRRHKPPNQWIKHPAIHVNDPYLIEMLMARE